MPFNSYYEQTAEINNLRIKPASNSPSPSIYLPLQAISKECPRRDLNPHSITGNGF